MNYPIRWFLAAAFVLVGMSAALPAFASQTSGTILASQKFGWGDKIGWINFAPTDGSSYVGLTITDSAVTGFAWSRDFGWINFSPSHSGQGVTNTSSGVLGGSAWVSSLGWISFSGVTINTQGQFVGIAGTPGTDTARVSFDCTGCEVATDWRPASVRGGTTTPSTGGPGRTGGGGSSGSSVPTTTPGTTPGTGLGSILPNLFPGIFGVPGAVSNAGAAAAARANVFSDTGSSGNLPRNLFDIALTLDKSVLAEGEDVHAAASFTSFGTVPTPAVLLFTLQDSAGRVVATTSQRTTVETEAVVRTSFSGSLLAPGRYTIFLHVSYGQGVEDDLSQPFQVADGRAFSLRCGFSWPVSWLVDHIWTLNWFGCIFWWIPLLALLLIPYGLYRYYVRRAPNSRNSL